MITSHTLLDAHDPKEVSESKHYDLTTHRKCFHASQSQRFHSLTCNFALFCCFSEVNHSWRGIKMRKSLCFHVCVNKKGLVRHVITPRTLLDAHGPKEVSKSKQYHLATHRKVFHASRNQRLDSFTCNFYTIYIRKTTK